MTEVGAMLRDRLRQKVGSRNRELAMEAVIEAVLGVVFTAIVFGVVFSLTWLLCWFTVRSIDARLIAGAVVAVYAIIAFISVWRRENPFEHVPRLTPGEQLATDIAYMLGHPEFSPHHARFSLAGAGSVLIAGPANIVQAIATWRHRLPSRAERVTAAAALLGQARQGVDLSRVEAPEALVLLHRLGLVKVLPDGSGQGQVALTAKGEELMHGGSD